MTRYADPERCPDCLAAMPYGATRCPSCGLSLEGPLAAQLFSTLSTADQLLESMRSAPAAVTVPDTPAALAGVPETQQGRAAEAGGLATMARPETAPAGGPPHGPRHPEAHPPGGISGASVPRILLGLGALCLLIAALVFLAVTWSAMGVAGRTATLVGFTAVAGGLTAWAARRDLRAAAESLGVVALGLLAFDMFGARDAGWLGDVTTPVFFVVLGTVIALAGTGAALAVRRTPAGALVGAEVVATLGVISAAAGGVAADWFAWSAGMTLAVVAMAAVAVAARSMQLTVLAVGSGLATLSAWVILGISSWDRALQNPSAAELWGDLEVWPLLATALLAGAPAVVRSLHPAVRLTALGIAAAVLAGATLVPFTDETTTVLTTAGAALLAVMAGLALALPQPWRRSIAAPGLLGLVWMTASALSLTGAAVARIMDEGSDLWTGGAGDAFPLRTVESWQLASWLLPVTVVVMAAALIAAARSFSWADRMIAPLADVDVLVAVLAGTTALTLALYAVPLWVVLAVFLAAGAGFVARSLVRQHPVPLSLAALFLAAALLLALHAEWLTFANLVVALAASATVHLRAARLEVGVVAGVLVSAAAAGLVWTVGAIAAASGEALAVAALVVLAALVLGLPYVDERLRISGPATYARLGIEVGALASAAVVSMAGVDLAPSAQEATWFAVYLTLMGAAASAMALLRTDRRPVGWLGGLLLAAASWVRLADIGVEAPEAYTLPSAVALIVVGLLHLRRNPEAGTVVALSPGLALALVPSLLWVLADPIALRSTLLGLATLGLVVAGARMRWSAPLVHGAVVGAVLVLRLATPIAEAVPRWALIGAAGALLVAMGITWEQRVRDARRVAGYVRGLR